ncbi:hypothetical protein KQI74_21705 [Paenibacillus barcinonensis]|uniref:hypothetical protein n=1 Tax=Paenibacillus TaxID=44249 RepID=UPI001C109DB4|nr:MULTISPECIES: hypothetical protein [Paenibacillus]MBU5354917.1 hypothetical protein [Paenibacillus barcinonensis]MDM5275761.1 hypothetical protein [Paenibacillus silvae]
MSNNITMDLDQLLQAERELDLILSELKENEREARKLYEKLNAWKGQSATKLRIKVEVFFYHLDTRTQQLLKQKQEMLEAIQRIKDADGSY